MLSIATDFASDHGDPSPSLRAIADAGFNHVHWCHQWYTDFIYSKHEIAQISNWVRDYGLKVLDLHASSGIEKQWFSDKEYERLAGVELVRNRIEMASDLGGRAIVMHIVDEPLRDPLRCSLDTLEPFARERGIRIAIENGDFDALAMVFAEYDKDCVGLCYDAGHGNLREDKGLVHLERWKDRLTALHLDDNDAKNDLHMLPFMGTTNWEGLAPVIASSAYEGPMQMEVVMKNCGIEDTAEFLDEAMHVGMRFTGMVEAARG